MNSGVSMKYYVALLSLVLCSVSQAKLYSFPQTGIQIDSKTPLFTDSKTGGLIPKDASFQFLAFEFDHTQPNNLMIRALKETWKKAGQKIVAEKDTYVAGFWGQEVHTEANVAGKISYTRNVVFGDFYKMAQVSIVCAKKTPGEYCKGSNAIVKGIKWKYQPDNKLTTLKSPIQVPPSYELYFRVNTKKGPVLMYTPYAHPMSDDSVAALTFAVNKGKLDTKKFLESFAKSSEMTGINPTLSNIKTKRVKDPIMYSWGKRKGSNANFYLTCGTLDYKKNVALMVCGTGDQKNYKQIHQAMHYLSRQ